MNTRPFNELVQGKFGRKTAYVNVERIDASNVVTVLGNVIGVFNSNKAAIKYLWDYKNGDQPILYRKKVTRDDLKPNNVVENHAWEYVRFKNAQTYGEPVQLVAVSDDDRVTKAVDVLNNYFRVTSKHKCDIDSGEWTSAVGTGYKAVCLKHGNNIPFCLVTPNPLNTFIVYSETTGEPLMSVQELRDLEKHTYYQCFTDTHEYKVQNSKLVYEKLHIFKGIPIVEYPNNQDRVSDIELVITILDAVNTFQSNRTDAIENFVQAWVKFVNCQVDEGTFKKMKQMGALVVKSNNGDNKADVDIMSQELNQTQAQVAKDDLIDNAQSILAIPNRSEGSGDRQGATALKNGWDFAKQAAQLKDVYIVDADMKLCEVVLNVLKVEKGKNECPITPLDFAVQINHSPLDNLMIKVESLQMLLASGIHPLVAIKTIPLWADAQEVYNISKPYLDVLYKTVDEMIEEQNLQGQVNEAKKILQGAQSERGKQAVGIAEKKDK